MRAVISGSVERESAGGPEEPGDLGEGQLGCFTSLGSHCRHFKVRG